MNYESTSTLQRSKLDAEQKMLLQLMTRIEKTPVVSQRALAAELGIALGLMNSYLKRCMKKGLLRATQVPMRRLAFFLTPEGFKEKSKLVASYLSHSLAFFRHARAECEEIFSVCKQREWNHIACVGAGELAEIAGIVAQAAGLTVSLVGSESDLTGYDAVLITDIQEPQVTYDLLKEKIEVSRILILEVLHLSTCLKQEEVRG
jgi:DNA-binding MarR family transcriptional regulator